MEYQYIRVERDDSGLATVTVSREDVLNALSADVLTELSHAVAELELDDRVRVVALTGAGSKAFVAGADVAQMQEMSPTAALALAELGGQLGAAMEASPQVYIAAVNGFALGGGCELAMCCDFIYASSKAKFGQPEVKLGVIPGFGGTQRLARRVGRAKATELCVTGDMIDADEALRIGLADKVCAPEELMSEVRAVAERITANGPVAVAAAKQVIADGASLSLQAACRLEQLAFAALFDSSDQREGMAAFLEKRAAAFQGK